MSYSVEVYRYDMVLVALHGPYQHRDEAIAVMQKYTGSEIHLVSIDGNVSRYADIDMRYAFKVVEE